MLSLRASRQGIHAIYSVASKTLEKEKLTKESTQICFIPDALHLKLENLPIIKNQ